MSAPNQQESLPLDTSEATAQKLEKFLKKEGENLVKEIENGKVWLDLNGDSKRNKNEIFKKSEDLKIVENLNSNRDKLKLNLVHHPLQALGILDICYQALKENPNNGNTIKQLIEKTASQIVLNSKTLNEVLNRIKGSKLENPLKDSNGKIIEGTNISKILLNYINQKLINGEGLNYDFEKVEEGQYSLDISNVLENNILDKDQISITYDGKTYTYTKSDDNRSCQNCQPGNQQPPFSISINGTALTFTKQNGQDFDPGKISKIKVKSTEIPLTPKLSVDNLVYLVSNSDILSLNDGIDKFSNRIINQLTTRENGEKKLDKNKVNEFWNELKEKTSPDQAIAIWGKLCLNTNLTDINLDNILSGIDGTKLNSKTIKESNLLLGKINDIQKLENLSDTEKTVLKQYIYKNLTGGENPTDINEKVEFIGDKSVKVENKVYDISVIDGQVTVGLGMPLGLLTLNLTPKIWNYTDKNINFFEQVTLSNNQLNLSSVLGSENIGNNDTISITYGQNTFTFTKSSGNRSCGNNCNPPFSISINGTSLTFTENEGKPFNTALITNIDIQKSTNGTTYHIPLESTKLIRPGKEEDYINYINLTIQQLTDGTLEKQYSNLQEEDRDEKYKNLANNLFNLAFFGKASSKIGNVEIDFSDEQKKQLSNMIISTIIDQSALTKLQNGKINEFFKYENGTYKLNDRIVFINPKLPSAFKNQFENNLKNGISPETVYLLSENKNILPQNLSPEIQARLLGNRMRGIFRSMILPFLQGLGLARQTTEKLQNSLYYINTQDVSTIKDLLNYTIPGMSLNPYEAANQEYSSSFQNFLNNLPKLTKSGENLSLSLDNFSFFYTLKQLNETLSKEKTKNLNENQKFLQFVYTNLTMIGGEHPEAIMPQQEHITKLISTLGQLQNAGRNLNITLQKKDGQKIVDLSQFPSDLIQKLYLLSLTTDYPQYYINNKKRIEKALLAFGYEKPQQQTQTKEKEEENPETKKLPEITTFIPNDLKINGKAITAEYNDTANPTALKLSRTENSNNKSIYLPLKKDGNNRQLKLPENKDNPTTVEINSTKRTLTKNIQNQYTLSDGSNTRIITINDNKISSITGNTTQTKK